MLNRSEVLWAINMQHLTLIHRVRYDVAFFASNCQERRNNNAFPLIVTRVLDDGLAGVELEAVGPCGW